MSSAVSASASNRRGRSRPARAPLWGLLLALLLVPLAAQAQQTTATARGPIPPPRRDVPGQRFEIPLGQVYVPDFFDPAGTTSTDVLVFFHGAAWCAQQGFHDARRNAVLVTISLAMDEYPRRFNDPQTLDEVLTATLHKLDENDITSAPLGRVALASFSGGYSAVREILRHGRHGHLICDVVLADSLYARRTPGTTDTLHEDDMAPFLAAARRAVEGGAGFQFTHLHPPKPEHRGNTTSLAAEYLIHRTGLRKIPFSGRTSRGARVAYVADKGNLRISGHEGMTTQDHFEHFYAIGDLFARTQLEGADLAPQD